MPHRDELLHIVEGKLTDLLAIKYSNLIDSFYDTKITETPQFSPIPPEVLTSRFSFVRGGISAPPAPDGALIYMFRVFVGDENAVFGKDEQFQGELEVQFSYWPDKPAQMGKIKLDIADIAFCDFVLSQIDRVLSEIQEKCLSKKHDEAQQAELERQYELEDRIEQRKKSQTFLFMVVGAVVSGAGFDSIFGIGILTALGGIAGAYAGILFGESL